MYVDPMLPFGLRSAPKIFNAVSDALNCYLHRCGIHIIRHYLDDFIIVAPPQSSICEQSVAIFNRECARLGVPVERDGPTTCLSFSGSKSTPWRASSVSLMRNYQGYRQHLVYGGTVKPALTWSSNHSSAMRVRWFALDAPFSDA